MVRRYGLRDDQWRWIEHLLPGRERLQRVHYRGHPRSGAAYFQSFPGVPQGLQRRGGEAVPVHLGAARLYLPRHGKKRCVLALKQAKKSIATSSQLT